VRASAILLAALLAGCAALPDEATYRNPLTTTEFADPAVLRAPDGYFYAYATQGAPAGRMLNIQVARSADLVRWAALGDALPEKPRWGATKQWFWAPHVVYDALRRAYLMYYSAEADHHDGKCLAVAVAEQPQGPFRDSGQPLLCGQGIEHIDPMAFDDPVSGKRLLYWGSGRAPIRVRELAPGRTTFAEGSAPLTLLEPDAARPYRSLIEAAWITYRDGWYYLFYSGDRCCTAEPRYAILVARARSALGPFEDRAEPVLERSGAWLAPGHGSVVTDDAGDHWMLYHAIDAVRPAGRLLLLDRIDYVDGWPRMREPSTSAQRSPRASPTAPH
jgi:arabinan endo-1,5-alpha-L-arabinosidase